MLIHGFLGCEAVVVVDPEGDARKAGCVGDGDICGAAEDGLGIKDVVDLPVLHHAVRMDARTGDIEVLADIGGHGRDGVAEFVLVIMRNFGDDLGVHTVKRAAEGGILNDHGLQRDVACPFADAEQRAVDGRCAVQPRRGGVGNRLVEVIMTVPLQHLAGAFCIVVQTVDNAGHAARERNAGEGYAVAHGVTHTDLDRDARLLREFGQGVNKGDNKAVEVGTGDVLQVATRAQTRIQGILDHAEIVFERLTAGHVQFFENVVVRAGDQNARLLNADIPYKGKILFVCADPGGDFGEFKAEIHTARDRMSQPQTESYTAAKGGIAALTHALAVSLSGKARVNSISPGWIDTAYTVYEGPDATQQPAGRVGTPLDIANMVLFLCSDKAGFITGENICIDGGMTKQMIYHGEHGWKLGNIKD